MSYPRIRGFWPTGGGTAVRRRETSGGTYAAKPRGAKYVVVCVLLRQIWPRIGDALLQGDERYDEQ